MVELELAWGSKSAFSPVRTAWWGPGHHALMIHAPSADESAHIMSVLREAPIAYGQKYRHLVIEDLVE